MLDKVICPHSEIQEHAKWKLKNVSSDLSELQTEHPSSGSVYVHISVSASQKPRFQSMGPPSFAMTQLEHITLFYLKVLSLLAYQYMIVSHEQLISMKLQIN